MTFHLAGLSRLPGLVRLPGVDLRGLTYLCAGGAAALAAGYGSITHKHLAYLIVALPVLAAVARFPAVLAVGSITLIPFTRQIGGGGDASDLLLAAAALLLVPTAVGTVGALHPLKPMRWPLFIYAAGLILVLAAHPTQLDLIGTVQRGELLFVVLFISVSVLRGKTLTWALGGFIITATALAAAYAAVLGDRTNILGTDKNPAGGFMVDAALILISQRRYRKLAYVCGPILGAGIIAAQSRGAILGLVAGFAVLVMLQNRSRTVLIIRGTVIAAVFIAAFQLLPSKDQARVTNVNGQTDRAIHLRSDYRADALQLFTENPLTGVGLNNYGAVTSAEFPFLDAVDDPHSVFYEEAAEGGLALLIGFSILTFGGAGAVLRRRSTTWGPTALAVQAAIIVHGCVDVYWVRGTPELGWLLLGVVLADADLTHQGPRVARWMAERQNA